MRNDTDIARRLRRWLPILALMLVGSGCSLIDEDLSDCRYGCEIRFEYLIYDADGGSADAFPSAVDRVQLYVFDADGRFVRCCPLSGRDLPVAQLDLPAGNYEFVAWAGSGDYSFALAEKPAVVAETTASLPLAADGSSTAPLQPLWHGRISAVLTDGFDTVTIPLTKDTRSFRILLQHVDGTPVPVDEFRFAIDDDNALLGADNRPLPGHKALYRPFRTGQTSDGSPAEGSGADPGAAWADLDTSRLVAENNPRLRITRIADGETVLDIPLLNYLYLLRNSADGLTPQQFLDRNDSYSLVFFLGGDNRWISTQIIINGWIKRLHDMEL